MHLEWQVILTQIVGFLIVLWLLRKYAWGRLLDFIDQRRQRIANQFAEIDKTRQEVDRIRDNYEKQLASIDDTRRAMIQEAARDADKLASEIREEARQASIQLRAKTERDLQVELDKANVLLRDRMIDAVVVTTEKMIRERLDTEKHKELIGEFLDEVNVEGNE
jgi:F-type H+-transporting ATPase subunit b